MAWHLGHALNNSGVKIKQVFSRNPQHAQSLAGSLGAYFTDSPGQIDRTSDLYILAVSDDAITKVAESVGFLQTGILVHNSGSVPMQVLSNYASHYGVIYPLQTLTKGKNIEFKSVPVFAEGCNEEVYEKLSNLFSGISDHVYRLNSHDRLIVHCAAVISSNFSNHLFVLAQSLLKDHGLSFDLLKPLMIETVSKAFEIGPLNAQTGPAKRRDKKVMDEHLKLLESLPGIKKIYEMLSNDIMGHWNERNLEI